MGLLAKLNAFDPERDTFAGALTDKAEQTKLGAFMSVVILPSCIALYSALYFVQFYYGFGEGAPPLYVVTTSETIQYGSQAKELALECTNPNGCYFRIPQGGAQMCSSGSIGGEDANQGNTDFCTETAQPGSGGAPSPGGNPGGGGAPNPGGNPGPAPAGRRLLADLEPTFPWQGSASRHLLETPPEEARCEADVECGTVMDADDGVCAFVRADPVDALTVAWRDDSMIQSGGPGSTTCQGACNFGVSLITDYLDESDGKVKQKKIKVHRGIVLLSLVERHDIRMEWDSSHPDYSSKSGKTVVYEWGITPVDIVGTIEASNLCRNDLIAEFGDTSDEANAKGVKLTPFPLYTKVTTSYPSPVMAYLAAVGGIAATLGGIFGIVHTLHLEYKKRAGGESAPEEKAPVENAA